MAIFGANTGSGFATNHQTEHIMILKKLLHPFLSFFRRLCGTEQIQQQLRQQQQQQLQQHQLTLLTLGNTLKHSLMDSETVGATTTYKRCAEIVSLLSPMDVAGGMYIRFGREVVQENRRTEHGRQILKKKLP
jgi:hypothetical protein